MAFLKGSAAALITPFTEEGADLGSLCEIIEFQIANGTDALVVLGTTGEPAAMDEREKEEVIRCTVERTNGRAAVIVGVGHNRTRTAVEGAKRAKALGADAVLAVTPYYNRCTQRGLIAYYEEIAGANVPVIAYNVPARTGVNLLPETAERLAADGTIVGIKEASGNMVQALDTMRRIRGKCDLYAGEDLLALPILCAGGTAVISVVANLVPHAVKELTEAVFAGRLERANALADALFPLTKACFSEVNPIPVKEAMGLLGFRAGLPRPPLTRLEAEHREELIAAMRAFGLGVKA